MTYAVPTHTKHSKDCLYHIEQEQVDCDCGGNMTDHAKKLEEIEGRHREDDVSVMCRRTPIHQDRAYLLSRVRELEADNDERRKDLALAVEQLRQEMAERDRLRAILDAPVTEEKLRDQITEWHTAELIAGNSVPDFWDECDTSERLATYLAARKPK